MEDFFHMIEGLDPEYYQPITHYIFIDKNGELAIPHRYKEAYNFQKD